jgi:hypothetical protein
VIRPRRHLTAAVALVLALGACSSGADEPRAADTTTTTTGAAATGKLEAQIASYDLVAAKPQRLMIGLVAGEGRLVTGGEIEVLFAHLGDGSGKSATGTVGEPYRGIFQPIAGTSARPDGPRLSRPSEGVGVYAVRDAVFDKPGRWGLIANVEIGGAKTTVQATFDVADKARIIGVGERAPTTRNPIAGTTEVPPAAIDSRAKGTDPIPDPSLHTTTIADAVAAGRPTVVVVSTPVYCVSQFCGPITDSVEKLATEYEGKASFVHLEVWQDFEKKQVNESAGQWIYRELKGDLLEPWVFVVGRDGTIAHRFDNIAGDDELRAAVDQVTA